MKGNLIVRPFDLEAFKQGQKAITLDGRLVNFVGVCEKCSPWHKLFAQIEGETLARNYFADGTYRNQVEPCDLDLVLVGDDTQELIEAHKLYAANPPQKKVKHNSKSHKSTLDWYFKR